MADMKIQITGKNMKMDAATKEFITRKVEKLETYSPKLVESHVILKKEKYLFTAEITLVAGHLYAVGRGKDKGSLLTAVEQALSRVSVQLKKFREKVKGHHRSLRAKERSQLI